MVLLLEDGMADIISAQLESVLAVANAAMASAPRSGANASARVRVINSNVRNRVFTVIRLVSLCMTRQALMYGSSC